MKNPLNPLWGQYLTPKERETKLHEIIEALDKYLKGESMTHRITLKKKRFFPPRPIFVYLTVSLVKEYNAAIMSLSS